jgi:copper chaperone CopZ
MTQTTYISGMTCEACEYKIQYLLAKIPGVQSVVAKRATNEVLIESDLLINQNQIVEAIKLYTNYKVIMPQNKVSEKSKSGLSAYKPLFIITAFIVGVAAITASRSMHEGGLVGFLHNFMTGFFLVFSFFKLLDVANFAKSFAMYDLLAIKWPTYGLLYPFIELGLGILCLIHFEPKLVYLTDILLMGFGAIGVVMSVLDKRKIKCACLGSVFDLPMSTVTIIENLVMVVVGVTLLVLTGL